MLSHEEELVKAIYYKIIGKKIIELFIKIGLMSSVKDLDKNIDTYLTDVLVLTNEKYIIEINIDTKLIQKFDHLKNGHQWDIPRMLKWIKEAFVYYFNQPENTLNIKFKIVLGYDNVTEMSSLKIGKDSVYWVDLYNWNGINDPDKIAIKNLYHYYFNYNLFATGQRQSGLSTCDFYKNIVSIICSKPNKFHEFTFYHHKEEQRFLHLLFDTKFLNYKIHGTHIVKANPKKVTLQRKINNPLPAHGEEYLSDFICKNYWNI